MRREVWGVWGSVWEVSSECWGINKCWGRCGEVLGRYGKV